MTKHVKIYTVIASLLLCSIIVLGVTLILNRPAKRIGEVKLGATKEQVLQLLGDPSQKYTNILVAIKYGCAEAWAYPQKGVFMDSCESLFSGHIFGGRVILPNADDYVVLFDKDQKVIDIVRPVEPANSVHVQGHLPATNSP